MTNPTRQDIINAHDALAELANYNGRHDLAHDDNYFHLLNTVAKAFPPKPRLTMADIEWDDGKHYLAEAINTNYGEVIMIFQHTATEKIYFISPYGEEQPFVYAAPEDLVPTGKRYQLTEIQELNTVAKTPPPKSRPTMADITWNDDEHYMAEALHPTYGKVAMYYINSDKDWIAIMYLNDDEEVEYAIAGRKYLIPTGKHYFRNDVG